MKTRILIAAGILAGFAASSFANDAFNGEAYYQYPQASSSSTSREQVKSEAAQAQAAGQIAYGEAGAKVPDAKSTKTRAEVLADLQIWRESGLAALEMVGEGYHHSQLDAHYLAAQAKYEELRASPRFAELVQKFSRS